MWALLLCLLLLLSISYCRCQESNKEYLQGLCTLQESLCQDLHAADGPATSKSSHPNFSFQPYWSRFCWTHCGQERIHSSSYTRKNLYLRIHLYGYEGCTPRSRSRPLLCGISSSSPLFCSSTRLSCNSNYGQWHQLYRSAERIERTLRFSQHSNCSECCRSLLYSTKYQVVAYSCQVTTFWRFMGGRSEVDEAPPC